MNKMREGFMRSLPIGDLYVDFVTLYGSYRNFNLDSNILTRLKAFGDIFRRKQNLNSLGIEENQVPVFDGDVNKSVQSVLSSDVASRAMVAGVEKKEMSQKNVLYWGQQADVLETKINNYSSSSLPYKDRFITDAVMLFQRYLNEEKEYIFNEKLKSRFENIRQRLLAVAEEKDKARLQKLDFAMAMKNNAKKLLTDEVIVKASHLLSFAQGEMENFKYNSGGNRQLIDSLATWLEFETLYQIYDFGSKKEIVQGFNDLAKGINKFGYQELYYRFPKQKRLPMLEVDKAVLADESIQEASRLSDKQVEDIRREFDKIRGEIDSSKGSQDLVKRVHAIWLEYHSFNFSAHQDLITELSDLLKKLGVRRHGLEWSIEASRLSDEQVEDIRREFDKIRGEIDSGKGFQDLVRRVHLIWLEYHSFNFSAHQDLITELSDLLKKLGVRRSHLEWKGLGEKEIEIVEHNVNRDKAVLAVDKAQEFVRGGIDLSTLGMRWKIGKDGRGVEMVVDAAQVARVEHEGIDWLAPVILSITPVANIWAWEGLPIPKVGVK